MLDSWVSLFSTIEYVFLPLGLSLTCVAECLACSKNVLVWFQTCPSEVTLWVKVKAVSKNEPKGTNGRYTSLA